MVWCWSEYPELVQKYLGSVVPITDNFYATLNSAVFSDGSFVYVPPGVRCPMELSTYLVDIGVGQAPAGAKMRPRLAILAFHHQGDGIAHMRLTIARLGLPSAVIPMQGGLDIALETLEVAQGNHEFDAVGGQFHRRGKSGLEGGFGAGHIAQRDQGNAKVLAALGARPDELALLVCRRHSPQDVHRQIVLVFHKDGAFTDAMQRLYRAHGRPLGFEAQKRWCATPEPSFLADETYALLAARFPNLLLIEELPDGKRRIAVYASAGFRDHPKLKLAPLSQAMGGAVTRPAAKVTPLPPRPRPLPGRGCRRCAMVCGRTAWMSSGAT